MHADIEHQFMLSCLILTCLAVVGVHSTSEEDASVTKSDVRELLNSEVKENLQRLQHQLDAMRDDMKKQQEMVQRQLDMVLNKLVSSSSLAISTKSLENTPVPRDCADVMSRGEKTSGVYTVYVGTMKRPVQVYCDMTTDGGGWTVFQRRQDGSVNFYHNWADYENGFGKVNGEHWLGNNILHRLTSGRNYRLRVDLADWVGGTRYAEYSNFKVGSACEKYKLTLGTYCGDAGDSLSYHSGQMFSTFDQDNDRYAGGSCVHAHKGAWWHNDCHHSNLNGLYLKGSHTSGADGVNWKSWSGYYYSLKFTEMKIRPVEF